MHRPVFFLITATLLPASAFAQPVRVDNLGCAKGVHLVAQQAPLSAVLAELSRQLAFELHFQGDNDHAVDLDTTRPAPELVARLMQGDSVVTDTEPDPKCRGQLRLTRVWVLPKGQDGPPPPREPTPMEMYRKAHGLPPEDPAK